MNVSCAGVVILDETFKRFGGIVVLPGCLLKDSCLQDGAKIAYGFLLMYAWEDEKRKDGGGPRDVVRSLMSDMNASDSKVRRLLHALQSAKLISTIRVGSNEVNRYFIESISRAYPDDLDWSKMTNPNVELSDLPDPDWSKMTNPNVLLGEQFGESVRELSNLPNPNVKRSNVNVSNVNVGDSQLDLSGGQTVLERLADEMSRALGARYQNLHLTYRMVDELRDPRSLRFYWRVAQMMPAGAIESTLSYVKDLELTGRLRKSKAAAFTGTILALAKQGEIKLRTKSVKGEK